MSKPSFQTMYTIVTKAPEENQSAVLYRALSEAWFCLNDKDRSDVLVAAQDAVRQQEAAASAVSEQRRVG